MPKLRKKVDIILKNAQKGGGRMDRLYFVGPFRPLLGVQKSDLENFAKFTGKHLESLNKSLF